MIEIASMLCFEKVFKFWLNDFIEPLYLSSSSTLTMSRYISFLGDLMKSILDDLLLTSSSVKLTFTVFVVFILFNVFIVFNTLHLSRNLRLNCVVIVLRMQVF